MNKGTITQALAPDGSRPVVALVAHDGRKEEMAQWAAYNEGTLSRCTLWATQTTGRTLQAALKLKIHLLLSGPLGGDAQLGTLIAEGRVDVVVFFWDPLTSQPHDVDVKALLRLPPPAHVPPPPPRPTAAPLFSSPPGPLSARLCRIRSAASWARSSGDTVRGALPMTLATERVKSVSPLCTSRRRSPSVKMPTSLPSASTTLAAPGLPSVRVITAAVSRRVVSSRTVGFMAPVRITSRTRQRRCPRVPPGSSSANCSRENPRWCKSVMASASPMASSAMVLVVGASPNGQASGLGPISSTTSAARASELCASEVSAMTGTPIRLSAGSC